MKSDSHDAPRPPTDDRGQGTPGSNPPAADDSPGQGPAENDPSRRQFMQRVAIGGAVVAGGAALVTTALLLKKHPGGGDEPPAGSGQPQAVDLTLKVNGKEYSLQMEPRVTLLDALHERLGLTGTKKGCDRGECGACTVHVNGRRINSCMTLAVMQAGKEITTIEGLAAGEELHPVQAAFVEHDAFQCGYCTPGQVLSAVACIREGHAGTAAEVREWMSGNLCRCSAYPNIVAAVQAAARRS